MIEAPRVHVVKFPDRRNLVLRWTDPANGRRRHKSAGTAKQREAERAAARFEAELASGPYKPASKVTWEEFVEAATNDYLAGRSPRTVQRAAGVLSSFEDAIRPTRLADATTAAVAKWQRSRRAGGIEEATLFSDSATLKAAFRWAHRAKLLAEVPNIEMPKRGAKSDRGTPMKGRPVTSPEFQAMIEAASSVVGPPAAQSWCRLLSGLWLSGLRLSEALSLTWQESEGLHVTQSGGRTLLAVPAGAQKSNRSQLLPIAPEFGEWLDARREDAGHVFPLDWSRKRSDNGRRVDTVSSKLSAIGRAAGVTVNAKGKAASAQDLRRSFGDRWAALVMPATLQKLMRHASIDTTLRYYAGREAETVMAELEQLTG